MSVNVGILGATGLVGQTILKVIEERNLPWNPILFAGEKSVGKEIDFKDRKLAVKSPEKQAFSECVIVFGATDGDVSERFCKDITDSGALYIDNSSAFRMKEDVPLVIPEINASSIKNQSGIIANPNCSTIICLTALYPVIKAGIEIERTVISSYQAVSGAGIKGITELYEQERGVFRSNSVFPEPICGNVIPLIGEEKEGESLEESKMHNEIHKILASDKMLIHTTCVRVPVKRCHSFSITLFLKEAADLGYIRRLYSKENEERQERSPAVELIEKGYPTPLKCSEKDTVFIGRLRRDKRDNKVISMFCCGDQLRKGAATNAVEIAEFYLRERGNI